jgi:Cdc6-like AAA superfamily ATPase
LNLLAEMYGLSESDERVAEADFLGRVMVDAYQQDILDIMADKARREIQDQEDKRFVKEVTMKNAEKSVRDTLDEEAVRKAAQKMNKAHVIQHLVNSLKTQVEQSNVIDGLREDAHRRDKELNRAHELLEFWRAKAFEFQKQVSDLMGLISPRDDV